MMANAQADHGKVQIKISLVDDVRRFTLDRVTLNFKSIKTKVRPAWFEGMGADRLWRGAGP
jgi:hypothetical protein